MFWSLTFHCNVLGRFHCWVVNERAFVFPSGVTWDVCDGVSVCVFNFHQLALQRHTTRQWQVIGLRFLTEEKHVFTRKGAISMNGRHFWAFDEIRMSMCTLRWKLKLVGAGLPSATHFRVTLSPSTRGSWAMTWRTMFSVESVQKIGGGKSVLSGACAPNSSPQGLQETVCVGALQRAVTSCRSTGYDRLQNAAEETGWIAVIFSVTRPNNPFKAQCFCSIWHKLLFFTFPLRKCAGTDKVYFKCHVAQVTSIFHAVFGINPSAGLREPHLTFLPPLRWKQKNC